LDVLVANPPYIASAEIEHLMLEVRMYDPHLALDGGPNGLSAYRAIARDAFRLLKPKGHLFLEIGFGQAPAVASILLSAGLKPAAEPIPDLSGIARVLHFQRS